ncbi:hypothetical protein CLOM_g20626 [Closterium sp. NIES-68]|nr:hypothetical protein CLOM_g20626 [Closterium sp. NIES-68]
MVSWFLEVKRQLRNMVISEEWGEVPVAKTEEGRRIRRLLLDDAFWGSVGLVLKLMTAVYEVLRAVDTRAHLMGRIYGLMLNATMKTNEAAEWAATYFVKKTGLLLAKDKASFLAKWEREFGRQGGAVDRHRFGGEREAL